MMNVELSASSTIRDMDEIKELLIGIKENLEPTDQCCIYRVPKTIRKINEEAYTPRLISIGPLHYGNEELVDMEIQKKRYMESFLERLTIEKWEQILAFIKENEQDICNCYAETSKLESLEFVTMILYDAIFIIELFWRYKYRPRRDYLIRTHPLFNTIHLDLLLLENQLPYFILESLFKIAFASPDDATFMDLSYNFFRASMYGSIPECTSVKHFTDMLRTSLLNDCPKVRPGGMIINLGLPCAVKLHESGIKLKCIGRECSLLDIKFEKRKQRIPWFKEPELQIPNIAVGGDTEIVIRNMTALEQCHYPLDTRVCSYIDIMDYLINTDKDVDLLVEEGIISNYMGDSASVANMFNKLCLETYYKGSHYYEICKELKAHYSNPWNHTKAKVSRGGVLVFGEQMAGKVVFCSEKNWVLKWAFLANGVGGRIKGLFLDVDEKKKMRGRRKRSGKNGKRREENTNKKMPILPFCC